MNCSLSAIRKFTICAFFWKVFLLRVCVFFNVVGFCVLFGARLLLLLSRWPWRLPLLPAIPATL